MGDSTEGGATTSPEAPRSRRGSWGAKRERLLPVSPQLGWTIRKWMLGLLVLGLSVTFATNAWLKQRPKKFDASTACFAAGKPDAKPLSPDEVRNISKLATIAGSKDFQYRMAGARDKLIIEGTHSSNYAFILRRANTIRRQGETTMFVFESRRPFEQGGHIFGVFVRNRDGIVQSVGVTSGPDPELGQARSP